MGNKNHATCLATLLQLLNELWRVLPPTNQTFVATIRAELLKAWLALTIG